MPGAGAAPDSTSAPTSCRRGSADLHDLLVDHLLLDGPARRTSCLPHRLSMALSMSIHVALEHRTVYRFDRSVRLVAARRAPATGTPLPHADPRLLADGRARASHFLNWQQDPFGNHLARLVFPEPARELIDHGRPGRRHDGHQPVRLLRRRDGRALPVPLRRRHWPRDLAPYLLTAEHESPLLASGWTGRGAGGARRRGHRRLPRRRSTSGSSARWPTPPAWSRACRPRTRRSRKGSGRAGTARGCSCSVLRRLGLAARFVSGYLVQLRARRDPSRRARRHRRRLHRPARLGRGVRARGRLDRPRPHLGSVRRRGPHPPGLHAAIRRARLRSPGRSNRARSTFEFSNMVRRHPRGRPASPCPTPTSSGSASTPSAGRSTTRSTRATCASPSAASPPSCRSTTWRPPNGTRRPTAPTSGPGPGTGRGAWPTVSRRAASSTTGRASGTRASRCPGGRSPCSGGPTGCRSGHDPPPRWPTPWVPAGTPTVRRTPQRCVLASPPAGPRPPTVLRPRATRTHRTVCGRGSAARPGSRPPPTSTRPIRVARRSERGDAWHRGRASTPAAGDPVGWVIPLHPTRDAGGEPSWATTRWTLAAGHGSSSSPATRPSACGCRSTRSPGRRPPADPDRSPFDRRCPRPARPEGAAATAAGGRTRGRSRRPRCASRCRDGQLHVFLPPLERLEHVRRPGRGASRRPRRARPARRARGLPATVRPPARQARSSRPDPGVIEVNVQPASSWPELVDIMTTVSTPTPAPPGSARRSSISTARHTGTGGGNHLTLGGPTPADSPLLRRPDLLRSLITYWQHHPSLSYLFSGRFIGPTSQAPRVDEARHDSLYELEIAFAELDRPSPGEPAPPWLVDRLLRHLLVDVTGNTHRAEFCIDKLFSPDRERGRLGLLELRGLRDAAPPADGAGAGPAGAGPGRPLLGRSRTPAPWSDGGRELHDRFLLPWYVAADIADVVDDLAGHGLDVRADLAGAVPRVPLPSPRRRSQVAGITIELRSRHRALARPRRRGERRRAPPRYVDSSIERLQVRVDGLTDARHVVTCNGVPVPLHADRDARDLRGRRALPGLEAAVGPAPDHRGPRPARVRSDRPLERALARRVHLPRVSHPGGPVLRPVPGQRQRGRGPPRQPVRRRRATRPARSTSTRSSMSPTNGSGARPRVPSHPGSPARCRRT